VALIVTSVWFLLRRISTGEILIYLNALNLTSRVDRTLQG
jgi:hypothetical protein